MLTDVRSSWKSLYEKCSQSIFSLCKYLDFVPSEQQLEVLRCVEYEHSLPVEQRMKRIAVKSGQGPGKTAISTIFGIYRTLRYRNAVTVVTAPTMRQCRDIWLAEAERIVEKGHPLIRKFLDIRAQRIVFGGARKWVIRTMTAVKEQSAQGTHEDHLTFVCDECSGIDRKIIETIKGTLSNRDSYLFAIGNPNTRDCAFFDMFHKDRDEYYTFTFNAEESPFVSEENISRIAREYGINSDVYRVRVQGEFPIADPTAIFSDDDILTCFKEDPVSSMLMSYGRGYDKQIGIDLARFGSDESVIVVRKGRAVTEIKNFAHTEPLSVVFEAFNMQHERGWKDDEVMYCVDAGGMGQGVMKAFYDNDKKVTEFHFGGKANDPQFGNIGAEAYFSLRRELRQNGMIYIPDDRILLSQLVSRKYKIKDVHGKTKIVLEPKEDVRKRDEPSPDRADALVLAFWTGGTVTGSVIRSEEAASPGLIIRAS